MIDFRMLLKHVIRLMPALLLCALLVPAQAASKNYTTEQIVNFDWKHFGKKVIDDADYLTKKLIGKSPEARARYIAHEVGRKLNAMKVMPNTSMLTRGVSKARYDDQSIGTCEHVTESLKDAMTGGGIDERRLLRIFGEKSAVRSANPFDVNRNHMALAMVGDEGRIVSYDLWMHGGEHGTFGGFDDSIWNGQDVQAWSDIMQKNGYLKQACEDCPDRSLKAPYQMIESLKDQAELVTRVLTAVPKGAVRFIVTDAKTGKALPNASVTVDGAVNSPVEKIRQSSSTDDAGAVTLNGIAQGPYLVFARHFSCTPYESGLLNLKPRSSLNIHLQCEEKPQAVLKKPEPKLETPPPAVAKSGPTEDQILAEYRSLLPASLAMDKKPWHTKIEIIANAEKIKPDGYKVNYKTYCIIEQGPDKGKDYACFEYDSVLDMGQIRSAVADMKKRLNK
jgi:hypothetical protein